MCTGGRAGVRYVITKFSYPWCSALRSSARNGFYLNRYRSNCKSVRFLLRASPKLLRKQGKLCLSSKHKRRGFLGGMRYQNRVLSKYLSLCTCNYPFYGAYKSLIRLVTFGQFKLSTDIEKNPGPSVYVDATKTIQNRVLSNCLSLCTCNYPFYGAYKSLIHRVTFGQFKLSTDIEKNPGPSVYVDATKTIHAPYCQGNVVVFKENAGQQCVAMSLCSLIYFKIRRITSVDDMIQIMTVGNQLYSSLSLLARQSMLKC